MCSSGPAPSFGAVFDEFKVACRPRRSEVTPREGSVVGNYSGNSGVLRQNDVVCRMTSRGQ